MVSIVILSINHQKSADFNTQFDMKHHDWLVVILVNKLEQDCCKTVHTGLGFEHVLEQCLRCRLKARFSCQLLLPQIVDHFKWETYGASPGCTDYDFNGWEMQDIYLEACLSHLQSLSIGTVLWRTISFAALGWIALYSSQFILILLNIWLCVIFQNVLDLNVIELLHCMIVCCVLKYDEEYVYWIV